MLFFIIIFNGSHMRSVSANPNLHVLSWEPDWKTYAPLNILVVQYPGIVPTLFSKDIKQSMQYCDWVQ